MWPFFVMKYVIKDCTYFNQDAKYVEHQDIYFDSVKISKICDTSQTDEGFVEIDGKGKFVVPGLINAHVHLFGSGKPSKVLGGGSLQQFIIKFCSTKLGNKVLMKIVRDNALNSLYSGVTTFRSVGDFYYTDIALRDEIKSGKTLGPRVLASGYAITTPDGHGAKTISKTSDSVKGLKLLAEEACSRTSDLVKICVTGGVMDADEKGPGQVKMSLEQTKAICDVVHKHGLKVASHTESAEGMKVAINAGVDTIEHGATMDNNLIAQAKKQGTAIVCTLTPAVGLANLSPAETKLDDMAQKNSKILLEDIIMGTKQALANDILVGMGTDSSCPFCLHTEMYRELIYFTKYLHVTPAQALQIASLNNAKVLCIDKITGSIEVGKSADMLIVSKDPLKDLRALKDLDCVICEGSTYFKPKPKRDEKLIGVLDTLL